MYVPVYQYRHDVLIMVRKLEVDGWTLCALNS